MSDTIRTISDLLGIFADNNRGLISAQDIRDLTITALSGQVYNVKAYGAKGDGTTDDTSSINTAIIAVQSTGGVLYFPRGTYIISGGSGITVSESNVTFRGDGDVSILKWSGSGSGNVLIINGSAVNFSAEDIAFQGPLAKHGDYSDPAFNVVSVISPTILVGTVHFRRVKLSGGTSGIHYSPIQDGNSPTLLLDSCDIQSYTEVLFPRQGTMVARGCYTHGCGISTDTANGGTMLNQHHGWYIYPGVAVDAVDCRFADYAPNAKGLAIQLNYVIGDTSVPAFTPRLVGIEIDSSHWSGLLTNPNAFTQIEGVSFAGSNVAVRPQNDCDVVGLVTSGIGQGIEDSTQAISSKVRLLNCVFGASGVPMNPATSGTTYSFSLCRFPNHSLAQAVQAGAYGTTPMGVLNRFSDSSGPGQSTTSNRPSASTAGLGAAWYDTTLGSPLYSNGTSWVQVPMPATTNTYSAAQTFGGGATISAASPNLLTANQADLEAGTVTGWGVNVNATMANVATQAAHGTRSLQITANLGGQLEASVNTNPGVVATAGNTYYGLCSFRAASISRGCQVDLIAYDSGNSQVSRFASVQSSGETTNGWLQITANGVAPANTATVRMTTRILTPASGEVHYIDKASISLSSSTIWQSPGTASILVDGTNIAQQGSNTDVGLFSNGTGSLLLNTGAGTGGVKFGDGAGNIVASVSSSGVGSFSSTMIGVNTVDFGSGIPVAGARVAGDIRWNTAVATGQPEGWRCTTGGTPGTWSAMANH